MKCLITSILLIISANCYSGERMAGGWTQQQTESDYKEIISNTIKGKLGANLTQIYEVQTQIVAGINYRASIKYTKNGVTSCANVKIYEDLNQNTEITKLTQMICPN